MRCAESLPDPRLPNGKHDEIATCRTMLAERRRAPHNFNTVACARPQCSRVSPTPGRASGAQASAPLARAPHQAAAHQGATRARWATDVKRTAYDMCHDGVGNCARLMCANECNAVWRNRTPWCNSRPLRGHKTARRGRRIPAEHASATRIAAGTTTLSQDACARPELAAQRESCAYTPSSSRWGGGSVPVTRECHSQANFKTSRAPSVEPRIVQDTLLGLKFG